jgi:hypothetical protein
MLKAQMANTKVKATRRRPSARPGWRNPRIIDLKPNEASILSLVARYAQFPGDEIKTKLMEVLQTSTPRARAIGHIMLGKSANARPSYRLMAKRFTDAQVSNAKNLEILRSLSPRAA